MSGLVVAPIVMPLLGAAVSIGLWSRRRAQRALTGVVLVAQVAVAAALLVQVDGGERLVARAGGWAAPVGITFVADRMAALLVLVTATTLLAGLLVAIGERGVERDRDAFHPVFLVLGAGLCAALLTADLFNLFVAFEIVLVSSSVLLTMGAGRRAVERGSSYLVLNLITSTMFLFTIAVVYAATGTVDLADLSRKVPALPDGVQQAIAVLLVVVLGAKSAMVPLQVWLPRSYPAASGSVAAVLAGLSTKVGVATLARVLTTVLPEAHRPSGLLLGLATVTMVLGVLGAIVQMRIPELLSFHIVSQVGYMLLGVGMFSMAGIAAAILFTVHQMVVKSGLFVVGVLVERRAGTDDLTKVRGMARTEPLVAAAFGVLALSLAGIPPLSGFLGKLALVEAGFGTGAGRAAVAATAVALVVSLLTLYSMSKIWAYGFQGEPLAGDDLVRRDGGWWPMVAGLGVLVVATLAITVLAGPLHELCRRAAVDLLDVEGYRGAVGP